MYLNKKRCLLVTFLLVLSLASISTLAQPTLPSSSVSCDEDAYVVTDVKTLNWGSETASSVSTFFTSTYACEDGYIAAGEWCHVHRHNDYPVSEGTYCTRVCIRREPVSSAGLVVTDPEIGGSCSQPATLLQSPGSGNSRICFNKMSVTDAITSNKLVQDIIFAFSESNFDCDDLDTENRDDYIKANGTWEMQEWLAGTHVDRDGTLCYLPVREFCHIASCDDTTSGGCTGSESTSSGDWTRPRNQGTGSLELVLVKPDGTENVCYNYNSCTFESYTTSAPHDPLGSGTTPSLGVCEAFVNFTDIFNPASYGLYQNCLQEEGSLYLQFKVANDDPDDNYVRTLIGSTASDLSESACLAGSYHYCTGDMYCNQLEDPITEPLCYYNRYCTVKILPWFYYGGKRWDDTIGKFVEYTDCGAGCYGDEGNIPVRTDPDSCSGYCESFDTRDGGDFNWAGAGPVYSDAECYYREDCCILYDPEYDPYTDPCSDYLCEDHMCVANTGQPYGGYCSDNSQCASGVCLPDNTCGCSSDQQCPYGQVCDMDDNTCEAPAGGYGTDCEDDDDCTTGVCLDDQTCGCTQDTHCQAGEACNQTSNECYEIDYIFYGEPCTLDSECYSGICNQDGLCGCGSDNDCIGDPEGAVCIEFPPDGDYECGCNNYQDCMGGDQTACSGNKCDSSGSELAPPPSDTSTTENILTRLIRPSMNAITGFFLMPSDEALEIARQEIKSRQDYSSLASITGMVPAEYYAISYSGNGTTTPYCCGDDVEPYSSRVDGAFVDEDCGFHGDSSFCDTTNYNRVTTANSTTAGDVYSFNCAHQNQFLSDGSVFHECARTQWIMPIEDLDMTKTYPNDSLTAHDYLCFLPENTPIEINGSISECQGNQTYYYRERETGYTDRVSALRKDNSTGNTTCYFCTTDARWDPDIDDNDEQTCGSNGVWTGTHCCGEACDNNEYYNDDVNGYMDWTDMEEEEIEDYLDDSAGCWDAYPIYNNEYALCTITDDDGDLHEDQEILEVINVNGTFHGCAIDDDYVESIRNPYASAPFSYILEGEDPLKPYNGSFTNLYDFFGRDAQTIGCNTTQGIIDENDDLLDIEETLAGISSGVIMTDHEYCAQVGDYLCSYEEVWKYNEIVNNTYLKHIAWIPEEEPTIRGGCCKELQCWNGTSCIDNMRYNQKPPQNGYRCIDGTWTDSEPKYTWDYVIEGYCPQDTQCLVSTDVGEGSSGGATFDDLSTYNYYNGSPIPSCINDSDYLFDVLGPISNAKEHLCEQGNWTTRTKYAALSMLDIIGGSGFGNDDYTLYCDDYNEGLNLYTYGIPDMPMTADLYFEKSYSACSIASSSVPCANKVCILKYDFNDRNEPGERASNVVFATSLNGKLNESEYWFTDVFGIDNTSCTYDGEDGFTRCDGDNEVADVWYNDKYQLLLASKDPIAISSSITWWDKFLSTLGQIWSEIMHNILAFGPTDTSGFDIDYNFINKTIDFDKIYLAKSGSNRIFALWQTVYEKEYGVFRSYVIVELHGIETDLCDSLNITEAYSCTEYQGRYYITTAAITADQAEYPIGNIFDAWPYLTKELRPEYGRESDYYSD